MEICEKMRNAGRVMTFLEINDMISVKKTIQMLNPSNSEKGFLLKSEQLMRLSNLLHEKICANSITQNYMNSQNIPLPLFTASDIDNYKSDEPLRKMAVLSFFEGLFQQVPKWGADASN